MNHNGNKKVKRRSSARKMNVATETSKKSVSINSYKDPKLKKSLPKEEVEQIRIKRKR